jgi:uncharacterized surface protein with fasciclin (FAS1) repeats
MNVNNSNFLTRLVSIVGATSIGILIGLPSGANEVLNPHSDISLTKENAKTQQLAQQAGGSTNRGLNPSPGIFSEPPYNRSRTAPTIPGTQPINPNTPPFPPSSNTGTKDLVSTAQSNPQFTKLTRALKAAGLTATLQGKGPFTLFAPTDAAFSELPQDAVAELFKPENKEVLVKILTYHVIPGQVLSRDLKPGEVQSLEGSPILIKIDGKNSVMVDDAKVTQTDIKASNGVIHVIDKVILPRNL